MSTSLPLRGAWIEITILKAKIVSLTERTETIIDIYEQVIQKKDDEISKLKSELEKLSNA